MSLGFPHLALDRWPFQVVPQPELCTYIAARKRLRTDVDDLISALSRRETSSIHLFWSWYGAGKTHTLYYIANRARQTSTTPFVTKLHAVYCEFPKAARSFLDVYRSLMVGLDTDVLIESLLEVYTSNDAERFERELFLASPDLGNALKVLVTGEPQDQVIALRWLRAEPLPVSEFRKVGISQKVSSAEEATRIFAALVKVLNAGAKCQNRHGARVIWLLDEFQRIDRTGRSTMDEINTGLHSLFNSCPAGFSLVLSFSGQPNPNGLPSWFSQELRDRIGRTKVMVLPPLVPDEALDFVKDVLAHARDHAAKPRSEYFPFTKKTCQAIIAEIAKQEELKPRAIMHAFNAVLEEADRRIEGGEMTAIPVEFAKEVLSEFLVLREEKES